MAQPQSLPTSSLQFLSPEANRPGRLSEDLASTLDEADGLALLYSRCAPIYGAPDAHSACEIALAVLTQYVAAESAAILLQTVGTSALEFTAASGPRADQVRGTALSLRRGIAGYSCTHGAPMIVSDVDRDEAFAADVDRASGYHTRSLLVVPIGANPGTIYGCVELLNSPTGFGDKDIEAARTVANTLANWLAWARP